MYFYFIFPSPSFSYSLPFCLFHILFLKICFGPTGPIFLNYITYYISAHFSLLLGPAPSSAGCSQQLLRCTAALYFPLLLLLKPAAASCRIRCTIFRCRLLCSCSAAMGCVWQFCHNCCCSSAAAAGCVQDNSLYHLSALAGTRTRAHTIGTSQPALSS